MAGLLGVVILRGKYKIRELISKRTLCVCGMCLNIRMDKLESKDKLKIENGRGNASVSRVTCKFSASYFRHEEKNGGWSLSVDSQLKRNCNSTADRIVYIYIHMGR